MRPEVGDTSAAGLLARSSQWQEDATDGNDESETGDWGRRVEES